MSNQSSPLAGPLVWIDCETTGLDTRKDKILEIAVLISNGNLELVDDGVQYIVRTDKEILDGMDEWCTNQHGKTGLIASCLESPHSTQDVSRAVLEYIKKWIPEKDKGILAGSSVHFDKAFLAREMPEVTDWLRYRIVDVSSIKEITKRWYPDPLHWKPKPEVAHRAMDDIKQSMKELKYYREHIFKDAPSASG